MWSIRRIFAGAALLFAFAGCSQAGPSSADAQADVAAAGRDVRTTAVAAAARPLTGGDHDYDRIVAAAAGATRILLGESTHGTHEYYRERARITERLVAESGVRAVAIEGDWSSTARVNRYVRGLGDDRSADEALQGYANFPRWMWSNTDFRDFVERLRKLNAVREPEDRVGVYGMDVYDLFDAADAVIAHLHSVDLRMAAEARTRYSCFGSYRRSVHGYGHAASDPARSCERQAAAVLGDVRRLPRPGGAVQAERHFAAVRAAASVVAAEEYFRASYSGANGWNIRDRHMARNVDEIAAHVAGMSGAPGKVVTWSHNTHTGDARASDAALRGEINLGQLMRQRHGEAAFLVGFFSHSGRVMAAPAWDRPGRVYDMRPALPESHSALFRTTGMAAFSLLLRGDAELARTLDGPLLERAIGVIYQPETERSSHYFEARLARRFDAVVYLEKTSAVTPLGR